MLALALTLAVTASPPTTARPTVEPPAASTPTAVQALDTPAQARALCDALTPTERLRPKGNAVERSRAGAEHAARREAALNGRYRVTIPAGRLWFAPYDAEERRLELSERAFLTGAGGALHVWAVESAALPVALDTAAAERLMQAAQRKTRALQQNPGLDGSVVAEVDAGGGARGVHLAADSLQDEGLTSCVRGVLSGVEFPRGTGERAEIPI